MNMKRNRIWLKDAVFPFMTCLMAAVIFALFMLFDSGVRGAIRRSVGYYVAMISMLTPLYASTSYNLTMPLALSFGATRKEVRKGLLMTRITEAILCLVLLPILVAVAFDISFFRILSLVVLYEGILLINSGLGGIFASLKLQSPRSFAIRIGQIFLVVLATAPVFMTNYIAFKDASFAENWIGMFGIAVWLILAVGIGLQVQAWRMDEKTVNNYNVTL